MKKAGQFAAFGAALCLTFNAMAAPQVAPAPQESATLRFYNLHTDEHIVVPHRRGQNVSRDANWFLRDFRRGERANMDPALFDLLLELQQALHQRHPTLRIEYQVVSGYRSPATNNDLRNAGGSQAKNSQHTHGKAIDIRVPGISTAELRNVATCLKAGGVGYYAADKFVHVDTGRVRYWPSHAYLQTLNCNSI